MADTLTANYSLVKPEVGASEDTWGTKTNTTLDTLDSLLGGGATLTGPKIDDDLSIVDNVDATKVIKFQVSGIATATTRTFTWPNFDGTVSTVAGTETLTNKTLTSPTITTPTLDLSTVTSAGDLPVTQGGTGSSTASAARTALGSEIGVNVQAFSTDLDAYAGIASEAEAEAGTENTKAMTPLRSRQSTQAVIAEFFHVQDQKTAGTDGGGSVSGSFETRDLNTSVSNGITSASLSANRITLPAGDYYFEASAPAFEAGTHRIRLQNITGAATIFYGTSEENGSDRIGQTRSFVSGRFTLGVPSALEVQHRVGASQGGSGHGGANGWAVEIYTDVKIWKVG